MRRQPTYDYGSVDLALALRACSLRVWVGGNPELTQQILAKDPADPAVDKIIDAYLGAFDGYYRWWSDDYGRMEKQIEPAVLTGRLGDAVVVKAHGTGIERLRGHLPPAPMTLVHVKRHLGDPEPSKTELRIYRCPNDPTPSQRLCVTEQGDTLVHIYGDSDFVRIDPTLDALPLPQTSMLDFVMALDTVVSWPELADVPVFDPAWLAGVR
jgi:hypothetical protein